MFYTLLSTHTLKDPYIDHTSCHNVNRYNTPITLKCYHSDNSYERESGTLINGLPISDYYDIECFNYKDILVHRYHFTDKNEANKCYMNLIRRTNQ